MEIIACVLHGTKQEIQNLTWAVSGEQVGFARLTPNSWHYVD